MTAATAATLEELGKEELEHGNFCSGKAAAEPFRREN